MSESKATEMLPLVIADIYEAAGALRQRGDLIAAVAQQTQARWQVLSVISEGDWTVPKVARRLGVTRQAIQRTVDRLHADRMIEFKSNPGHERSPLTHLTPAGRGALAAITTAATDWHNFAATGLSQDDLKIARTVLQAITTAAHDDSPKSERSKHNTSPAAE